MKKLLLLSAALLAASLTFAQTPDLHQFIQKHKTDAGMTFAFLSKDLFNVATDSKIQQNDWKKAQNVVKDFGSLTILVGDSLQNSRALYKEALHHVPKNEFDELFTVRDGDDHVRFWAKTAENIVSDLILLVGSTDEFVLINFTGSFDLTHVLELIPLFNTDQAQELAQTSAAVAIDFSITPNPSKGNFTINYTESDDLPQQLTVTDQNGRQVTMLQLNAQTTQQVNLQDLPAGLYWLQLRTEKGKIGIKQVQIVK